MSGVRFNRSFTERADAIVALAAEEAQRFSSQGYVGTEHLLLALIHQRDTVACRVFSTMGIDVAAVEEQIDSILRRGDGRKVYEPGLTPRARKVIALAMREAGGPRGWPATTGHLLLGMLAEGEGIAASILEQRGMTLEEARSTVTAVLESHQEP